jgi:hypothetical protein
MCVMINFQRLLYRLAAWSTIQQLVLILMPIMVLSRGLGTMRVHVFVTSTNLLPVRNVYDVIEHLVTMVVFVVEVSVGVRHASVYVRAKKNTRDEQ